MFGFDRGHPKFWKKVRNGLVIGSREALEKLAEKYKPSGSPHYVTDYHRISRPEVEIEEEPTRVAEAFRVSVEDLKKRRRYFPARLAVYYHLVEHCGMSRSRVAMEMGVSPMAVTLGIRALKNQMFEDSRLEKIVQSLNFKL